jgi:large subunit ribosomal protein L23
MKNKVDLGNLLNLIKYPLVTEKAISLYTSQQYTFIVDRKLSKTEIKFLLEKVLEVTILSINTCNLPTKLKRIGKSIGKKARYKKAYITLKKGQTISALNI